MDELSTIKTLLLISGPSGVGKSSLITDLKNGCPSPLAVALGFDGNKDWEFMLPYELKNHKKLNVKRIVLHYDHNNIWVSKSRSTHYADDRVFRILDDVETLIVVTLWEPPEVLFRRCNDRIRKDRLRLLVLKRTRATRQRLLKWRRMHAFYKDPYQLWVQYLAWFQFCDELNMASHFVVRSSTLEFKDAIDCRQDRPFWDTN